MKITKRMMEKAEFAAHQFLEERIPEGALPGGVQLFAEPDDHLDPNFKHEKGAAIGGLILYFIFNLARRDF